METFKDDLANFDRIIKSFTSDNGILQSERKEVKDWFSEVTFKLEEVSHDLSQNRIGAQDADGDQKREDKFEGVEVVPFKNIQKQIENNYGEIQKETAIAVLKKLGAYSENRADVATNTNIEYVPRKYLVRCEE